MRLAARYCFILVSVVTLLIGPLGAQNILNNGGFETGLMCYYNWIWSVTGVDFAGDYKFLLSSDSHSGSYSAEMICTGSDCLRAAYISDTIQVYPTTPGFQMSIFSKCPTGTVGQIYVPAANFAINLTCNGAWSPNSFSFQTVPGTSNMFYYIMLYGPTWLEVDDVVLTYADGTAPAHQVLYPGVRNVSVSGQNVIVDGSPYLSLGFYDVPYADLGSVAATGANTINGSGTNNVTDCYSTGHRSYLDAVFGLGLNFLPIHLPARESVPLR